MRGRLLWAGSWSIDAQNSRALGAHLTGSSWFADARTQFRILPVEMARTAVLRQDRPVFVFSGFVEGERGRASGRDRAAVREDFRGPGFPRAGIPRPSREDFCTGKEMDGRTSSTFGK